MKRALVAPAAALAALAAWALPAEARAQGSDDSDAALANDPRTRYQSPQNFALELRFGPYRPDIDSEFEGLPADQRPFRQTFGNGKGFHFGAEFDWQALRVPFVGTFGPGFGWSYVNRSADAFRKTEAGAERERAEEKTSISVMPMYAVGVLRVDYPSRRWGVPVVPYGKAGLGFALWSASIESGVVTRNNLEGRGRSWGTHFALGAAFLLDVIDPAAAHSADKSIGVNNTYAYVEWMRNDLGDLLESKPQMRVGTSTWVVGLALEF